MSIINQFAFIKLLPDQNGWDWDNPSKMDYIIILKKNLKKQNQIEQRIGYYPFIKKTGQNDCRIFKIIFLINRFRLAG